MFKAVIFDVAGVLTEGLGAILLEAAAGIEGDLDQLAEALIPVFMGEGDSDVAGHRLERGEITLISFYHLSATLRKKHGRFCTQTQRNSLGIVFSQNQKCMILLLR